jgi:hypothetical protein
VHIVLRSRAARQLRDRVAAHASTYAVAGRALDDLAALETAIRGARPRSVAIIACSSEAPRAWLAAVEKFNDLPLALDTRDAAAICAAGATMPVAQRADAPAGIDDARVRAHWQQVQP